MAGRFARMRGTWRWAERLTNQHWSVSATPKETVIGRILWGRQKPQYISKLDLPSEASLSLDSPERNSAKSIPKLRWPLRPATISKRAACCVQKRLTKRQACQAEHPPGCCSQDLIRRSLD